VLNKDPITFAVTRKQYTRCQDRLILLSSAVGAAVMLLIFFIRDTSGSLRQTYQRKQKKDMMVQELYSKALNAILADDEEERVLPSKVSSRKNRDTWMPF